MSHVDLSLKILKLEDIAQKTACTIPCFKSPYVRVGQISANLLLYMYFFLTGMCVCMSWSRDKPELFPK